MKHPPSNISVEFLGAAQTVTGSMHLVHLRNTSPGTQHDDKQHDDKRILLDCGFFQGKREESRHRNRHIPRQAVNADCMILSHAHIDHSGNIPNLIKSGFKGRIHCTKATKELCQLMLRDSARIQENDAKWINKKHRDDPDWKEITPIYTEEDAERCFSFFDEHSYDECFEPIPGVSVTLKDSGHVLGAASVILDIDQKKREPYRLVFSGDIGRKHMPILRDPVTCPDADAVIMESTYGDRRHADAALMTEQLADVVERTAKRGGKIIIPSFALERTQEIIFFLNQLCRSGRLPDIPVFVDSPLAVNLTEVFRNNPECYDKETLTFDESHGDPFGFSRLKMVESVDESKSLNDLTTPAIIISASGMCEAGRILHHLRNNIGDSKNTVVIVGFQAPHTLGRRLVEKRDSVRIFGLKRELRCEVKVLNAFSAHADKDDLLWWAKACGPDVQAFYLVHGDPGPCEALARQLKDAGKHAVVPQPGQICQLL